MNEEQIIRIARVFGVCRIFGMPVKLNDLDVSQIEKSKIDAYLVRVSKEISKLETPQEKIISLFTL